MKDSLESVEKAAKDAFPDSDISEIMTLLNTYGVEPYERERERVQLTIIKICQGDASKLSYQIEVAKIDYRDILVFANRPLPSPEEGANLQAKAQEILKHWGKK